MTVKEFCEQLISDAKALGGDENTPVSVSGVTFPSLSAKPKDEPPRVGYEYLCNVCYNTWDSYTEPQDDTFSDPHNIGVARFVQCSCGTRVYLERNTNKCEECGRLYNLFGQSLRPVEEWDEEDRDGGY